MFHAVRKLFAQANFATFYNLLVSCNGKCGAVTAGSYREFADGLNDSPPAGSIYRPDLEERLVDLANAYRGEEGKGALKADPLFQRAARAHAADMMINGFMGHRSSTGRDLASRISVFIDDPTRLSSVAENAARDTRNTPVDAAKAKALFSQWVKSRPHRKALLNRSYQFVSTGVIQKGNKIWAVQIFFSAPREKGLFQ